MKAGILAEWGGTMSLDAWYLKEKYDILFMKNAAKFLNNEQLMVEALEREKKFKNDIFDISIKICDQRIMMGKVFAVGFTVLLIISPFLLAGWSIK